MGLITMRERLQTYANSFSFLFTGILRKNMLQTFMLGVLFAAVLSAQSSRGTVTGLVQDPSSGAVANATVELANEETKVSRSTTSNEAGIYRFDAVDPGRYTIRVSASGFKVVDVAVFEVLAGQEIGVNASLQLGSTTNTIEVYAEATQIQTEAPVRGGTVSTASVLSLPIATQNPVSLSLTLPGVSTNRYSFGSSSFSVNGARGRSNNFLIDGTENNDISVAGQAFQILNPDAVQEVAVQTSNFDSEYGRAGGAVVNTITKSGTNAFHGTARYYLDSTFDDAPTNLQKLDPNVIHRGHPLPGTDQYFSGTVGGPLIRNKTFFFSAFQEERQVSSSQVGLTTFSAAGRAKFLSLFPTGVNARADLLNQITKGADANSQFANIVVNGQNIEVGTLQRTYGNKYRDRQLLERVDHNFSNNDQLSVRYLLDDSVNPTGGNVGFSGFDTSALNQVNSALINETHSFKPGWTNEFRLGYNRIYLFYPSDATSSLAATIPTVTIAGFTSYGVPSNLPQGRIANNYELQDAMSYVFGKHSLRFGTSLLDQRSKQAAPFNIRGTLSYAASTGFTGLANYLDDFGGSSGSAARDFGSAGYYPGLFRQGYFFQDRWRASENLTLTLGLRYEYFGEPINSLRTPAYTGLFNVDPVTFTGPWSQPNKVDKDLNNFSPTIGLAFTPPHSDALPWFFGEKKTVFRTGFQMGYDSFFNNIASNAVASAPNNVSVSTPSTTSVASPRGLASLSSNLPSVAPVLSPTANQTLVVKNLVNPYYMRWSFGFQRDLPGKLILDASYVGSRGVRLFINEDMNPVVPSTLRQPPAGVVVPASRLTTRLDPLQGSRLIRTNGGSSSYHSFQSNLSRRFDRGVNFNLAYTHARFMDNGSDVFGSGGNGLPQNTALPSIYGGLTNDKAVSNYDRPNRLAITSVYELPFGHQQKTLLGHMVGGWEVSGIYTFESGAPINITNGFDADGIGGNYDRPNFNPNGLAGVRAVPGTSPTGYVNPDNGNAPIDPATARYIVLPACTATVPCKTGNLGRFTARTPVENNINASILKRVNMTERLHLEFRAEFYNALNHRQYGIPSVSVFDSGTSTIAANAGTSLAGRFLNPGYANGGARVIRYQLKFVF